MIGEAHEACGVCCRVLRRCLWATVALLAVPALATACPSYDHVKAYSATSTVSYSQTATGNDDMDGMATISISHRGLAVTTPHLTPVPVAHRTPFEYAGHTTGGTVSVSDSYTDQTFSEISGTQTASGTPTGGETIATFLSPVCSYQVTVSFGIPTASSGTWPTPPDLGVWAIAVSPARPIPGDLRLSGSATVPAQNSGSDPLAQGSYVTYGLPGGGSQWESTLDDFSTPDQPVGTATFTWNLTPTLTKPKSKKPKPKPKCVVPGLHGKRLAVAKHDLTKAHCTVGKIGKHKSPTVANGKVISSTPKAGSTRKAGTKVALTVSTGKPKG